MASENRLGTCEWCEADAVVIAGEKRACVTHLDDLWAAVLGPVQELIGRLRSSPKE